MSTRIELLKQFIQEDPNDPFNKYALALECLSNGLSDEANDWFVVLLKDHPDYLPTYYQAAHYYWDQEKIDEAESAFLEGIKLATEMNDQKALKELNAAYQNFQFELE